MTLIISSIENDQIYLLADTAICFDAKLGRKPYHALKILALSPTSVLAFSGAHELALDIFFELHATRACELEVLELTKLVDGLRTKSDPSNIAGTDFPDFLLASTAPNLAVYRINDHGVSECPKQSWIGNELAAAFISKSTAENSFDRATALELVLSDDTFGDVGGHAVVARGDEFGFKFIPRLSLTSPRHIPAEGWQSIDFGTAQTGGYGFTTITPRERGRNGYGVFYFQGRFGFFFHVNADKKTCESLKAYAATPEEFMQVIEAEVGFKLEHCGTLN